MSETVFIAILTPLVPALIGAMTALWRRSSQQRQTMLELIRDNAKLSQRLEFLEQGAKEYAERMRKAQNAYAERMRKAQQEYGVSE